MIAPYPNITNVPSTQGSGNTCLELPSYVLCDSIYQNITASKKQALHSTVNFEKKRKGKGLKGLKSLRFKVMH